MKKSGKLEEISRADDKRRWKRKEALRRKKKRAMKRSRKNAELILGFGYY